MQRVRNITFTPALLLLLALFTTPCRAQYNLGSIVIDEGGQRLSSSGYICGLSVAQDAASSTISSAGYRAVIGFWHKPYAPPVVGIKEDEVSSQGGWAFVLSGCRPNPFRDATTIGYSLPTASDVKMDIMNTAGRVVTTLVNGKLKSGRYQVSWDVAGVPSSRLPGGIYFVRLKAGEFSATRKLVKLD